MTAVTRLLFVWNEDFSLSGGLAALGDLRRGAHGCTLCTIAYHRIRQRAEWKHWLAALRARGIEVRQPCRNQLKAEARAAADGQFPCVLGQQGDGQWRRLVEPAQIDACAGQLPPLQAAVETALSAAC